MRGAAAPRAAASPRSARARAGLRGARGGLELQPRHRDRGRLGGLGQRAPPPAPTRTARRRRPRCPPSRAGSARARPARRTSASAPAASSTPSSRAAVGLVERPGRGGAGRRRARPSRRPRAAAGARARPAAPPPPESASAAPSTPQRREEAPARSGVGGERLDHEVAPARVDPVDSHGRPPRSGRARRSLTRRARPQEVVGEPVDEVGRRPAGAPLVECRRSGRREVALATGAGRRVEHRQQQLAVLGRERREGRRHRRPSARSARLDRRLDVTRGAARRATKRRIRSGVKCGCSTIALPWSG